MDETFWSLIDATFTPEEQNVWARIFKMRFEEPASDGLEWPDGTDGPWSIHDHVDGEV